MVLAAALLSVQIGNIRLWCGLLVFRLWVLEKVQDAEAGAELRLRSGAERVIFELFGRHVDTACCNRRWHAGWAVALLSVRMEPQCGLVRQ